MSENNIYDSVLVPRELDGRILDIGGGGEGVIGRVYGAQVTAIDNRQEELDEAPEGFTKLLMDASALDFENDSFEHVTAFYSFMFIDSNLHDKVVAEAARVLRERGQLHIWDADITSAFPEPFIIALDIDADGDCFHSGYGVMKYDAAQSSSYFIELCTRHGFSLSSREQMGNSFKLVFSLN